MTATIAATITAADPVPAVQVDVTMDNSAQVLRWSITRDTPDASVQVWLGSPGQSAMSVFDYTAPLGVPITYSLTVVYADATEYVSSAPVTITGTTGCYLTNPATNTTMRTELATWPERVREPRQAVLDVLGRPDPVGLTDTHATPRGTWTLITRTDADRDALTALLTSGAVVVLRTQPGSSIVPCTALVGKINERRYSGTGGDQRRLFEVDIQEIAPLPGTALPLNATLGGLAIYNGATSLMDLHLLRETLLQLSQIPTG